MQLTLVILHLIYIYILVLLLSTENFITIVLRFSLSRLKIYSTLGRQSWPYKHINLETESIGQLAILLFSKNGLLPINLAVVMVTRVRKPASFNPPCLTHGFAGVTCKTMNLIHRSEDAYRRNNRWIGPWWDLVPRCSWNSHFIWKRQLGGRCYCF